MENQSQPHLRWIAKTRKSVAATQINRFFVDGCPSGRLIVLPDSV